MPAEPIEHLWIIGAGRMGLALGTALTASDSLGALTYTGRRAEPPPHALFGPGGAAYTASLPGASSAPSLVLIAVPDASIGEVARDLARADPPSVPVLHASGVMGSEVLGPLAAAGISTGSIHPLVAVAEPLTGAALLEGAWYGIEGDPASLRAAQGLVAALKGRAIRVEASRKPLYHAAAVMASNYVVTLLATGERLLADAGVPPMEARAALADLASGAISNVVASDPVRALTGPIARGDLAPLEIHLRGLSPGDRSLYSELARHTLQVARLAGLDAAAAARIDECLQRERRSSP